MIIVATALARNEADVVEESVHSALHWADRFVIYDNGSTDDTPELAEKAGAVIMRGPVGEPFNEGLRQHTLDMAREFKPDWIMRIDIDEIYNDVPYPRKVLENALAAEAMSVDAIQAEFWVTLDDVKRGLLLENERVSVQLRRRWYSIGHTATVAWRDRPDLFFSPDVKLQRRRNVPILPDGRGVTELGPKYHYGLLQRHYNCRSFAQLLQRMKERAADYNTFGKYRYNVIVDESIGLYHLEPGDVFNMRPNHDLIYEWYRNSQTMLDERKRTFGW